MCCPSIPCLLPTARSGLVRPVYLWHAITHNQGLDIALSGIAYPFPLSNPPPVIGPLYAPNSLGEDRPNTQRLPRSSRQIGPPAGKTRPSRLRDTIHLFRSCRPTVSSPSFDGLIHTGVQLPTRLHPWVLNCRDEHSHSHFFPLEIRTTSHRRRTGG